jgi:hypothetical protein
MLRLNAVLTNTCERYYNTSLSHVYVRLSAPMSSSAFELLTAPSAQKDQAAGGSSKAGVAGHATRERQCVVADGVVVQSGHPIRAVDVPN